jgi:hypothetical protein
MAHYRCEKCGKIEEATQLPSTCPACGVEATAAYPGGPTSSFVLARESFDRMFDSEPAPPRPKERRAPTGPAFIAAITVEEHQPDATRGLGSVAAAETSGGSGRPAGPVAPLSSEPTLELKEADLEGGPPPSPRDAGQPVTSERGPDARPAREDPTGPALSPTSTVELKDDDLEAAGQTPPVPGGRVVIDGLGSPKELHGRAVVGGLAARNTLELDEEDIVELVPPRHEAVSGHPSSPDFAPSAAGAAANAPHPVHALRGRVAYPIPGEESGRAPAARPREVDDVAVAGEPPVPPRRARPLTSQTETLRAFKARKRRRTMLGGAFVLGAVAIGAVAYLVMSRAGTERATAPDAGRPDLASPDARRPDLPRDLAVPDQPPPDAAISRPVARGAKVGTKPAAKPEVKRDEGSTARGGIAELYQEGLQRLMRGENAEAARLFNAVLARSPSHGLACRGLGLAYEKMGRTAMAREAFNRYLSLQPSAPDAEIIRKRIERLK